MWHLVHSQSVPRTHPEVTHTLNQNCQMAQKPTTIHFIARTNTVFKKNQVQTPRRGLSFPTAFELSLTVVRTVFASKVSNALPTSAHLGADLFYSRLVLRNIFLKSFHPEGNLKRVCIKLEIPKQTELVDVQDPQKRFFFSPERLTCFIDCYQNTGFH